MGVAVDASGNVYIADAINCRIREVVKATGVITTIAGNGTAGFSGDGGAAASAELRTPEGVYVDAGGNVYIADVGNYRIREVVHATGNITTVAGNGVTAGGGDGGAPTSASLDDATGVVVDGTGDVFIADDYNNRVREIPNTNPSPILGNLSSTAWTVNQAGFSGTIAVTAGTAPYSNLTVTGLPAGLTASLSGSTISISGTPTATGTFNSINASVKDSTGATASRSFSITINAAPTLGTLSATQWTVNQAGFNGTIGVTGGTGAFSNLTWSGLPSGLSASLSGNTITVSGTPTATGTFSNFAVSVRDAAGAVASSTYSITINPALTLGMLSAPQWTVNRSSYYGTIAVSGGTLPYSYVTYSGLPTGLSAYVSANAVTITGTLTALGAFNNINLTVGDSTGATVSGTYAITINAAPTLGSLAPSQWTVGQAGYSGAVPITNGTGPFTLSAHTNLPTGLSAAITGTNVTFTGTPTAAGTYSNVQLTVQDAAGGHGQSAGTYSITINAAPTLGTLSATAWTVNQAGFSGTIGIMGGTSAFSNLTTTGLPAGLTAALSGTTITLSGTPTATGTFNTINVSVKDAAGVVASHTYSITINAAPTLGTLSASQWTVNRTGFSATIVVTGGTGTYSSLTYSGLPTGLSASLSGSIITVSGTPTATGSFSSASASRTPPAPPAAILTP